MEPKYTYEQLMEKLVRAKMEIQKIPKVPHKVSCTSDDPHTGGDCDCGADEANRPRKTALEILHL